MKLADDDIREVKLNEMEQALNRIPDLESFVRKNPHAIRTFKNYIDTILNGRSPEEQSTIINRFRFLLDIDIPDEQKDALPRLPTTPFEELLPKSCWFSRYLEWVAESEASAELHFGSVITYVAAAIGMQAKLDWGAREVWPNLYTILVGDSGARKGGAISKAHSLVPEAVPMRVFPREGSYQGYVLSMRAEYERCGVACGLISAGEFSVLAGASKHKEGLMENLTDWYDSYSVDRTLAGAGEISVPRVCISVLGGTNMEWARKLPPDAAAGGYLPRHIIWHSTGARHRCWNPQFSTALEIELRIRLASHLTDVPEVMGWTQEAETYLANWYENEVPAMQKKTTERQVVVALDRCQVHVMKMAAIIQLCTPKAQRDKIEIESCDVARRIWERTLPSFERLIRGLGQTPDGDIVEDVLRTIRALSNNRDGAAETAVVRRLRNRWPASRVRMVMASMRGDDLQFRVDPTLGKVWWLTKKGAEATS